MRWTWVWVVPEDGNGQGNLVYRSPWGCKESDRTEWLNWTELNWILAAGILISVLQRKDRGSKGLKEIILTVKRWLGSSDHREGFTLYSFNLGECQWKPFTPSYTSQKKNMIFWSTFGMLLGPYTNGKVSVIQGQKQAAHFPLWHLGSQEVGLFWLHLLSYTHLGKWGGVSGKELLCRCRTGKRCEFEPWVGKISCRRAWQPTLVFLSGESHGQRSLAGYSP